MIKDKKQPKKKKISNKTIVKKLIARRDYPSTNIIKTFYILNN